YTMFIFFACPKKTNQKKRPRFVEISSLHSEPNQKLRVVTIVTPGFRSFCSYFGQNVWLKRQLESSGYIFCLAHRIIFYGVRESPSSISFLEERKRKERKHSSLRVLQNEQQFVMKRQHPDNH
ncbi:MAG: hypothetical protein AAF466_10495, partial [Bacteroidota bacterium]